MQPDYSFQPECVDRIWNKVRGGGVRRLVATAPTGAGKAHMIKDLFERELAIGGRPIVYTNRKTIRSQLSERLDRYGIEHGIRAAGHKPDLEAAAQVSSIPTEAKRSLSTTHPWELANATLALIDEAHSNKGATAKTIIEHHVSSGCPVIGLTATPVDLQDLYDELLVLIRNSELRRRGVIVPCDVFAGGEFSTDGIDLSADGDYVMSQVQQRFEGVKWAVIGNVLENYRTLNPGGRPAVLFPPGVPESRWFAEYLTQHGVPTEHVDAETEDWRRSEIFERLRNGQTKILTSYGVVQEGWDMPEAEHCILCRPTRSAAVFVQMVGRVLRACAGKERACLQDHVGAWHTPGLGSPNADRDWKLEDTARSIFRAEKESREEPADPNAPPKEPACCPKCKRILKARVTEGWTCPCGHVFRRSVREVIQLSGKLERKVGTVVKPKKAKTDTDDFRSALYQAVNALKHSGRTLTVGQVYWLACQHKKKSGRGEWVSRAECEIWIPPKDDPKWKLYAKDVYPQFFHKVTSAEQQPSP